MRSSRNRASARYRSISLVAASAIGCAAFGSGGRAADVSPQPIPASLESRLIRGAPGGVSDLAPAAGARGRLWATTDRGPNGIVEHDGKKCRTLLDPAFTPRILEIEVTAGDAPVARVARTLRLVGRSGKPLSGRPNGIGRDEPIFDPGSGKPLPPDPNGVDTEGIVQVADGSFWMVEEYRPSLLHVSASGRLLERFVPEGTRLAGADCDVRSVLPAAYAMRLDNRGFESIAVSPDGTRLWMMPQSPLENGAAQKVAKAGNVRLLEFDTSACRPVAEHLYRLGDPDAPDYLTKGAAPADGKLCALAAIDAESLLVIEQDDTGLARLYQADLQEATDTLAWWHPSRDATLEEVSDLNAAGISPVRKSLIADLATLLPAMRREVYGAGGRDHAKPLKLEGMAILGPDRVALVNDNDFGVHGKPGERCSTCLWILRLKTPLVTDNAPSARAPQKTAADGSQRTAQ